MNSCFEAYIQDDTQIKISISGVMGQVGLSTEQGQPYAFASLASVPGRRFNDFKPRTIQIDATPGSEACKSSFGQGRNRF